MRSTDGDLRDEVIEDFEILDAAVSRLLEVSDVAVEALSTREQLARLERLERVRRRLPAVGHSLINALHHAAPLQVDGSVRNELANRLRITRAEASRRIHEAAELGPRRALIGEPLEPVLVAAAAAQRGGALGRAQISIIRGFMRQLPGHVTEAARVEAEADLVGYGCDFRPDQLAGLAEAMANCYHPDGNFTDEDRARRRGVTIGRQGRDGMSPISGFLDPPARATLDAVCAKLGAPGMANPGAGGGGGAGVSTGIGSTAGGVFLQPTTLRASKPIGTTTCRRRIVPLRS